jgi:hypothetical protein
MINAITAAKWIAVGHTVRPYNSVTGKPVRVTAVDRTGGLVQIHTSDNNVQQFAADEKVYRTMRG